MADEVTLEEDIIYNKLIGQIPIYEIKMDTVCPNPTDSSGENLAAVSEEDQIAQYMAEICQRLETMEATRENLAFRPIYSCRRFIGWLIVFFKRIVRKCLKWYLEPVCFQQTDFNNAVTPTIGRLTELQNLSLKKIKRLEGELATKEAELEQLQTEMREGVSAQINLLTDPLESQLDTLLEKYAVLTDSFREMETRYTQMFQQQADKIQHQEQLSQVHGGWIEQLTTEHNGRLDALEDRVHRTEQLSQVHGGRIEQLAMEHNGRLDALEDRAHRTEQLGQVHGGWIEQLTMEHNGRLDALEDRVQRTEQLSQVHGGWIEQLTMEHNGRLDVLEEHFSNLANHYSVRMDAAEKLLQELEDEGAFVSANLEQQIRRSSLSQSGEDTILAYIFMVLGISESQCSYLDLGANHAQQRSNTYYFYQKGSRGVLVEANPKLMAELKFYRSGDIVLNRCIDGESGKSVDFYIMSGDGLSTPDREQAEKIVAYNPAIQIEDVISVQTITVNEILDTYFDGAPVFINIDVEGAEMEILASIDFEAHRPLAVVLEMIPYRSHLVVGEKNQEILQFMQDKEYIEYAFTGINSIFLDKRKMRDLGVLE